MKRSVGLVRRVIGLLVVLFLMAGVLLCLSAAAAQRASGRHLVALRGEMFGVGYSVDVVDGPGIFRAAGRSGCASVSLGTDDSGASGCSSARRGASGLAGYGLVCETGGRFLYGLAPRAAVSVKGTTSSGRIVVGRVRTLPADWTIQGGVWLIALPSAESLRRIEAFDRDGLAIASYRFATRELRCRRPLGLMRGKLHRKVAWTFAVKETLGADRSPNVCKVTVVTVPHGAFSVGNGDVACAPVRLLGHGPLVDGGGEHGCFPSYAVFSGLTPRKVSRVDVVLQHGRRLRTKLIRIAASARVPFNAFVAATGKNDNEIAYLFRTRAGHRYRVRIPPGPPIPRGC